MKFLAAVLLSCLFLAGSAHAVTDIQIITPLPMFSVQSIACSDDAFSESPGATIIWVIYVNGRADTFIDGEGRMPIWSETLGGKPGYQYPVSAGTHSVVFFWPGYRNYSVNAVACSGKVTYVYYNKPEYLVTTALTTVPTATTPLPATTTVPATAGTVPVTAQSTQQQTLQVPAQAGTTATASPDTTGSFSVKTDPAGAFIFIDGVQRGVTPATLPGIPAGDHTLLLKLEGYQDISTPVTVIAGKTQEYSSAMARAAATTEATAAATAEATGTPKKSPGFAFILALAGLGAALCLQKGRAG